MTIFQFEGFDGSGVFVEQMAFQSLTNGKNVYTLPSGHIVTPPVRLAGTALYATEMARPRTVFGLSIFCATAPTVAPGVIIRVARNGAAVAGATLTLANAVNAARGVFATAVSFVAGDQLDIFADIEANEGALSGTITAWCA